MASDDAAQGYASAVHFDEEQHDHRGFRMFEYFALAGSQIRQLLCAEGSRVAGSASQAIGLKVQLECQLELARRIQQVSGTGQMPKVLVLNLRRSGTETDPLEYVKPPAPHLHPNPLPAR